MDFINSKTARVVLTILAHALMFVGYFVKAGPVAMVVTFAMSALAQLGYHGTDGLPADTAAK